MAVFFIFRRNFKKQQINMIRNDQRKRYSAGAFNRYPFKKYWNNKRFIQNRTFYKNNSYISKFKQRYTRNYVRNRVQTRNNRRRGLLTRAKVLELKQLVTKYMFTVHMNDIRWEFLQNDADELMTEMYEVYKEFETLTEEQRAAKVCAEFKNYEKRAKKLFVRVRTFIKMRHSILFDLFEILMKLEHECEVLGSTLQPVFKQMSLDKVIDCLWKFEAKYASQRERADKILIYMKHRLIK